MLNKTVCPLESFEEERYLKLNPDVKNVIAEGIDS